MSIQVVVKHQKNKYDVEVDTTQPGEMFKLQLYSLTNVEPERQKLIVKGKQIKDDTDLSKLDMKAGTAITMLGTPSEKALAAPKEKMKFVEDMTEAEMAKTEGATPSGLQNLGNTCYMNSTLQALRAIPELQNELKEYKPGASSTGGFNPSDFSTLTGGSSLLAGLGAPGGDLTGSLGGLYKQLGETTGGFPPFMFLEALRKAFPQFAQKSKNGQYAQQDAEECYSQILDELRRKLKKNEGGSEKSFVDTYLAGRELSSMKCDEETPDEPPVESEDTFMSLKCHINADTNHLRDGLKAGLTEKIEKNSPTLDREAVYTKSKVVTRLPKYLTCHFVRFFWKKEIKKKAKIMRKVTFPMELDAVEFCSDDLKKKLIPVRDALRDLRKDSMDRERARKRMKTSHISPDDIAGGNAGEGGFGSGSAKKKSKEEEEMEKEKAAIKSKAEEGDEDWSAKLGPLLDPELSADPGANQSGLYDLIGVVTHQGASADSGHYCAYVKKEKNSDGRTWYFFNDDQVSEVDEDKIQTLAGGGESHSALILLYRAVSLEQPESK